MEKGKPLVAETGPSTDFDAVCNTVRASFETSRVHAVSLHDDNGDVLWLTESSMGPDEHNAVREAFESFANPTSPPILAYDLGDSRSAVLFRATNSQRVMVGAVMTIMDARGIQQDGKGLARLMSPKLQRAINDFAGMRPSSVSAGAPKPASSSIGSSSAALPAPPAVSIAFDRSVPIELTLADSMRVPRPPMPPLVHSPATDVPLKSRKPIDPTASAFSMPAALSKSAAPSKPSASATARRQALPLPPVAQPRVVPDIDRLNAALRRSPIALHVQRLVPLVKGTQLRRYEVLLRSAVANAPNAAPQAMLKAAVENGLGSLIDRRVVTQLVAWLMSNPSAWRDRATMFSVNLTRTAMLDEHFIKFVGHCLEKSSLPKSMIAFEIDVPTAVSLGEKVMATAVALERLACPIVLDEFGLRTECFELLRLPGVRYVKLAAGITAQMRSDKVSQAAITAVVQMARVLGMHTVAKHTETAAEHEWLTALGVDFVQSNALSAAASIESLIPGAPPAA